MATQLDGPRIEPRSGGAARHLVVFLHGYGADGNDLIDIGRAWATGDAAYGVRLAACTVRVRPVSPLAAQWFPLYAARWASAGAAQTAAPMLEHFLDAELARRISRRPAALVGFSQGTMMALHVGLRRNPPLAIIGFSGMLVGRLTPPR